MQLRWYVFYRASIFLLWSVFVGCQPGEGTKRGDLSEYEQSIMDFQKTTLEFLEENEYSPFANQGSFVPPAYFPIDSSWKIEADLLLTENDTVYSMATTDGKKRRYTRYGYVVFERDGNYHRLYLLNTDPVAERPTSLFLPFRDATSGNETYGGGRYLEVPLGKDDRVIIDFNKAYNPYCVYNSRYSCPVPPAYNNVDVAIEAGEKAYPGKTIGK